jgi:hypothetical protein
MAMYLLCVALIISIVHLCLMSLYKISKSHVMIFDIFRPNFPFLTTVSVTKKSVGLLVEPIGFSNKTFFVSQNLERKSSCIFFGYGRFS